MRKFITAFVVTCMLVMSCIPVSAADLSTAKPNSLNSKFKLANEALSKKYHARTYGTKGHLFKLSLNKPIEVSLSDGTTVEYVLKEENSNNISDTKAALSSPSSIINPMYSTTKTLTVEAVYDSIYGCLEGRCRIDLSTNCTWTNRTVTINRAYSSSSGDYLTSCTRHVSIINSVGDDLDDAISQCGGSYSFNYDGNTYGADYCFQSLIDPGNSSSAELNIIY